MLDDVRIRNLGVIEDATLPLQGGFTVVTGETGAGKTMLVAGLALLFGARADASQVSAGATLADVEGRLLVGDDDPVAVRAADAGGSVDEDGSLIISRSVSKDGRSRASAGGRSVPVGVLAEIGESALSIHGQSAQLRLARERRQREVLDEYGGGPLLRLREKHAAAFTAWRALAADLAARQADDVERRRETQMLQLGLEQIERVDVVEGEEDRIDAEVRRLVNADAIRAAVETAKSAIDGDETGEADGAGALIGRAGRSLAGVTADDAVLGELAERLSGIGAVLTDVSADLSGYADTVAADPQRLDVLMARRSALKEVIRSYGGADGTRGVLRWAEEARRRIDALDDSDERIAELRRRCAAAEQEVASAAAALSAKRRSAAGSFASKVNAELATLALGDTTLAVRVRDRAATGGLARLATGTAEVGVSTSGADEVSFEITSGGTDTPRPLGRGVSGGELSRIMLAIEVVLAGTSPVGTMVFDEVDAGVGGEAATEIGRRLARLGSRHQVLAVTHLPQVAAYADQHVVIEKSRRGQVTRSDIVRLDDDGRVAELTRMLAGLRRSESGRRHAAELLATARRERR